MQILYSYLRFTDSDFNVFSLLLTIILSELDEKPRRKYGVAQKSIWKNIYEGYHSFWPALFLMSFFVSPFVFLLPFVYTNFTYKKIFFSSENGGGRGRGAGIPLHHPPPPPPPPFLQCLQSQQETLRVVTIPMICSTLASL